jgi:hypothetical protein
MMGGWLAGWLKRIADLEMKRPKLLMDVLVNENYIYM